MSLSIGIVGLPNVGKSTLFNALTGNSALAANYPFATIEPNTGTVPIPDERLTKLSQLYGNTAIKPATVKFIDIAGLVSGASEGEGLGNKFLGHIRDTQAICHVVRAFKDSDVQHVTGAPRPIEDISIINTELVLADLQTVNGRLTILQKESRNNPSLTTQLDLLLSAKQILESNTPLHNSDILKDTGMQDAAGQTLAQLQLLTIKPVIYMFNVDESTLTDQRRREHLINMVTPSPAVIVCAKMESALKGLQANEVAELLASSGVSDSGLAALAKSAYDALGLQSYLTAGPKEVRAWTIRKGSTAQQAAGVIHSDIERGFIAAETVSYGDLIKAGSLTAARAAGRIRLEGKSYVVQPDDVINFRFNV